VRVLDALKDQGLSHREARQALERGKVRLLGIPTGDAARDVDPAVVVVRPDAPRLTPGRDLVLVHRDDDLAVVWKPPNMLSVPAPRRAGSALQIASSILGEAHAVHRIDEETSGLLLFARSPAVQAALKALFERHAVERRYLAIVSGAFVRERTFRSRIVRDRGDGLRGSKDDPSGKEAVTHVRPVEALDRASVVEARLETGRTHQVRIHLAEAGHPLLGEPLYADTGVRRRAPRLALHSAVLGFVHPTTGLDVRWTTLLPDDLEQVRRGLVTARGGSGTRSR
jgi:23S rRNA pseudouridine1911/1915/1917 synthase